MTGMDNFAKMNPLATLLNWLAPLLHPLGDFRNQASKLATIHQNSVHTFSALAGGLVENQAGPEAFTGELETSFWERVQTYLNAENALIDASVGAGMAGGNAATMEGIVAEASATCEECAAEITTAAEIAAAEVAGDVVLDEVTGIVDAAAVAEVGANPIADVAGLILTIIAGAALIITLTKLAWDIYHAIQHWQSAMNTIADTPLYNLPPNPTPVPAPTSNAISPMNSGNDLSDAQKRLLNDVRSRLGNGPYNDAEIEALIRAGYLDPDAIAAMIRGGVYSIFNNPTDGKNIATLMNELTPAQQQRFIATVEQYQKTHPDLTSHQVYNALRYTKMKAQLTILSNNIIGKDPTDPLSQAIANQFPTRTQEANQRLYLDAGNRINAVTDPFTVTDDQLKGWYSNLTGKGAEWASIKHYYQQGKLVDFSVPLPTSASGNATGEVDIKINENGVEKWVELKNVLSSKGQWGSALEQAKKYAQNGAKDVILQFPQQGVNGNPDISQQQLNNLQTVRRLYPGVTFEVITGASDPSIRLPFDPPSNEWGAYLP